MKFVISFLLFFILLVPSQLFCQISKANQYYADGEYSLAIPVYLKVLKKNPESSEALQRTASCYRILKNYKEAEIYYAELIKKEYVDPIDYFYYGLVLKNNGKVDEAKQQFLRYSLLSPNDKSADISVKSCDDIKLWVSRGLKFEAENIKQINGSYADFCPITFRNQLLFTTERSKNLVEFEQNTLNSAPYLDVYASNLNADESGKTVFSKPKQFSASVNTEYHDGPLSISSDLTKLFITRVENIAGGKGFVNRPKIIIYESDKSGKGWINPKPFLYNSNEYSVQHPAISPDGHYLFFASDMPGGYGANDIYVSQLENQPAGQAGYKWSQPKNLGPDVNSQGNEVFPYVRTDGLLFYSSDGLAGFGGLDIFSAAKKDTNWTDVIHYDLPLNSATDDFGICFIPSTLGDDFQNGYFSSDNRKGGKGSDDVYSFKVVSKSMNVAGKVLLSQNINDPAKKTKVLLFTEDGTMINFTSSDSLGFFQFKDLSPDMKFFVTLDENDPNFKAQKKYFLADTNNRIVRATVTNDKGGKFTFMNLPADPNSLPVMEERLNDFAMAGKIIYGDSAKTPFAGAKVYLYNEKGEVVKVVYTNAAGAFAFSPLSPDEKYIIKVDEDDPRMAGINKLIMMNLKGETISILRPNLKQFKFELLPSDQSKLEVAQAEDVKIKMNLAGKLLAGNGSNKPLENVKVELVNDKGEVVQTMYTDEKGQFDFTQLPPDQNFMVRINEEDSKLLKLNKIIIADTKGNVVSEMVADTRGGFSYQLLASDKNTFSSMSVDDSKLRFSLMGGIINGDGTNAPIPGAVVLLVNAKEEVLQRVTSDKYGHFIFHSLPSDNSYMLSIDGDADILKNVKKLFLTDASGRKIKEINLNKKGQFNFELLASDNVNFGLLKEEEVKMKYSLRGGIVNEEGIPVVGAVVLLLNDKEEVIQKTTSDKEGRYIFRSLPSDNSYTLSIDGDAPMLKGAKKIFMTDAAGKKIKEINLNNKGQFDFQLLAADNVNFGLLKEEDSKLKYSLRGGIINGDGSDKPIPEAIILLVNDKEEVLQKVTSDKQGHFIFHSLPSDNKYMLSIDGDVYALKNVKKIFLTDASGKKIKEIKLNNKGQFDFALLAADDVNFGLLKEEDSKFNTKFIGKLVSADSSKKVVPGAKVNLVNDKGDIIATGYTNEKGEFVFENLPADQNFFVRLDDMDASILQNVKMQIMNDKGEVTKELMAAKGKFDYQALAAEQTTIKVENIDESNMRLSLKGKLLDDKSKPIISSKVMLVDANGEVIQTAVTDKTGRFIFSNLPPDLEYSVVLDENDPQVKKTKRLLLTDEKGVTIKELAMGMAKGGFKFSLLPSEKNMLGKMYVEDEMAGLKNLRKKLIASATNNIKPNDTGTVAFVAPVYSPIHFDFNKSDIPQDSASARMQEMLDYLNSNKKIKMEIYGHTDSKGSEAYNKSLSYKRANAAVRYFVKNGISNNRLKAIGLGEKYPILPNENIDKTDYPEGRAQNRRIEFKIIQKFGK